MLINLSNHPLSTWPTTQLAAARAYGELTDLPFPNVSPDGDEAYIRTLVDTYIYKVKELAADGDATIHVMGEMTFTYAMVNALKAQGFRCIASTTERDVVEENGVKTSVFRFVRFREYI
ncbi:MAG: CRISPR-associated protein [Mediterranea sp.]|jgi:hypothetical protein|nr:CRISPR-associated protein [Mediterranea sp.]